MAVVAERLRFVTAPDGRDVAFAVWGDPDGFPVLRLHGMPGCRLMRWTNEAVYADLGVCFVTHDRAGYGRSSRLPGRRVVDDVDDVRLIADELGFDRFGVSGASGGGPHALACAARLPERVIRATCVVSTTPYGPAGLDHDAWFAGMATENVKEFELGLQGEDVLIPAFEKLHVKLEAQVAADASKVLDDYDVDDADRARLTRPETMQMFRETVAEYAVNGVFGWTDDMLALMRPWGFDVAEIAVPVLVRYGARDVLVPPGHGEWLAAHVPGCAVKVDEGAGHLAEDPIESIAEDVRWLRDGIVPA